MSVQLRCESSRAPALAVTRFHGGLSGWGMPAAATALM